MVFNTVPAELAIFADSDLVPTHLVVRASSPA
jgi:hypothetical protein